MVPFLLGLAVAGAAEEPRERLHAGVSVGVGSAYDAIGIRGELGTNHLGLFVGTGLLSTKGTNSAPGGGSVCFGARWYSEVRRGWFAWAAHSRSVFRCTLPVGPRGRTATRWIASGTL